MKQKKKNSISPQPTLSPSTQKSINKKAKSGSLIKNNSAYKSINAAAPNLQSHSNTIRDVPSLKNVNSESSHKAASIQSTKATAIELDEETLVTKVNLNSKKAPHIFCFNIRWILLLWGLLLCCYDSTMLATNIFNDVVFLKFTYHYVFFLTLLSGPALFYLMISEKVSIICWKIHISCQIFRVIMNIYLFVDYYFAFLDSLEDLMPYHQQKTIIQNETKWIQETNNKPEIEKQIRTYFAVFLSLLSAITILTIIMFGFAINEYYFEKEALKRKREKWRNRINKILDSHQAFIPPETEEMMSSDIVSSTKYSYISKKPNK
uniref:Uncharacterized protein n=1 Tax=Panagrolaimus davidi TaxID=227884 RepID=A0A914QE10_9BILA